MTAPRIHLADYSIDELRQIEAGPLADWLAWQAMGAVIARFAQCWTLSIGNLQIMEWAFEMDRPWREHTDQRRISTDPGAAMTAFIWLSDQHPYISLTRVEGTWVVDKYGVRISEATTAEHAIALALALFGWDAAHAAANSGSAETKIGERGGEK